MKLHPGVFLPVLGGMGGGKEGGETRAKQKSSFTGPGEGGGGRGNWVGNKKDVKTCTFYPRTWGAWKKAYREKRCKQICKRETQPVGDNHGRKSVKDYVEKEIYKHKQSWY